MISFKQYLQEQRQAIDVEQLIKENCGPYLKEVRFSDKDLVRAIRGFIGLERGIKNGTLDSIGQKVNLVSSSKPLDEYGVEGYIVSRRKDRKPRDTNVKLSQGVDQLLEDKFGWKPRAEGVFTFPVNGPADGYGDPWAVFPIGNFRYVWSPQIMDLTATLADLVGEVTGKQYWRHQEGISDEDAAKVLKAFKNEYLPSFRDHSIRESFDSIDEVILDCDKYLIIRGLG
jgi:hypothetical protein